MDKAMCSAFCETVPNFINNTKMSDRNKETKDNKALHIGSVSVSDFKSFIEWKDNQNKDYLGGKFMYDIKGYYKRLDETELFDYWIERVHSR